MKIGVIRTVVVDTSPVELVAPNPRRVALIIGAPMTNRVTISQEASFGVEEGLTLHVKTAPIKLGFD